LLTSISIKLRFGECPASRSRGVQPYLDVAYIMRSEKSEHDDDLDDNEYGFSFKSDPSEVDNWEPGARKLDENANFGITNDSEGSINANPSEMVGLSARDRLLSNDRETSDRASESSET